MPNFTFNNRKFMPLKGLDNRQYAIEKLMELSTAQKIPRFELSGDITSERMNYEILMKKITDNNLLPLIEGKLEPVIPVDPGTVEDFKLNMSLGNGPKNFQQKRFTVMWVIMNTTVPEMGIDPTNLTREGKEACVQFLKTQPKKIKAQYIKALEMEKMKHLDRLDSFHDRLRSLMSSYDRKLADYIKEKEIHKAEQIKYDEKVAKLNELLSTLFSENAINDIRPLIEKRQYDEALIALKNSIFKDTVDEGNYLRKILFATTYNQEMNFPVFLKAGWSNPHHACRM